MTPEQVERILAARAHDAALDEAIAAALAEAEHRGSMTCAAAASPAHVDVVFEPHADSPDLTFVEVEVDGRGVDVGEWLNYGEGNLRALRITVGDVMAVQS